MKRIAKVLTALLLIPLITAGLVALRIYTFRKAASDVQADAAIVLGAAVWGTELSPVFRERVSHAVNLYRTGKVQKLIFTGGQGNPGEPAESSAARLYALQSGVPDDCILIEEKSHTTYENILYAKDVADAQGLRTVLIVSDPLHMWRAVEMARDAGMQAYPSPTPSSKYQSVTSQATFLAHETYLYIGYLMRRPFLAMEI